MRADVNLWPYIFVIYALALASGVSTWIMSQKRSQNEQTEEATCIGLGATIGLSIASVVMTMGAILG
jgi:hypothetical protein